MAILIWMASPSVKGFAESAQVAFPLHEYQASYHITWHGMEAGKSHHTLIRKPNGEFYVETRSEPRMAMLPFRYLEASDFAWTNGKIKPLTYIYDIHEGKRTKKGKVIFNWKNKTVSNLSLKSPWQAPITDDIQSKLTQTLCLRQALVTNQPARHFTVAEIDKFKEYDFIPVGTEKLQTKLGQLETLKIEHRSKRGYRTTLWLAKNFQYTPVKMIQYRDGKVAAQGEIISYKRKSA